MVSTNHPPPQIKPAPIWTKINAGDQILRLYNPDLFEAKPLSFRTFGPLARFDHHRLPKQDDPERGILYAGKTLSCCIVEVFGDMRMVEVGNWKLAKMTATRDLLLLDLRGSGAMKAGTVAGVCKDSNRSFSQEWSKYFYENSFLYEKIDGLAFSNAHNDEDSYVFYERASNGLSCGEGDCVKLSNHALEADVRLSATENNLLVRAYKSTP